MSEGAGPKRPVCETEIGVIWPHMQIWLEVSPGQNRYQNDQLGRYCWATVFTTRWHLPGSFMGSCQQRVWGSMDRGNAEAVTGVKGNQRSSRCWGGEKD